MIKGTRMIVITREKILKMFFLILMIILLAIICLILKKSISINAFSEYENIINTEIVPVSKEKEKPKEKKKKSKAKNSDLKTLAQKREERMLSEEENQEKTTAD